MTKKCFKCGCHIYFSHDFRTVEGKWIPVDSITHEPHKCRDKTEIEKEESNNISEYEKYDNFEQSNNHYYYE